MANNTKWWNETLVCAAETYVRASDWVDARLLKMHDAGVTGPVLTPEEQVAIDAAAAPLLREADQVIARMRKALGN